MAVDLAAFTLTTTVKGTLSEILGLTTPNEPLNLSLQMKLTDGTGAEKGNQWWVDKRTLGNGASENLDLYGVLENFRGQTVNFTVVRAVLLVNRSTASSLEYGGAAANPWYPMFKHSSDIGIVHPAGANYPAWAVLAAPDAAGLPIGAASADILKIAHGGEDSADLIYDIVIAGEV